MEQEIKYDRKNVDNFVKDLKKLTKVDIFRFLIFSCFYSLISFGELFRIWDEVEKWESFSLWEKANVLFALAPMAEKIIKNRARHFVKLAREKDND